MSRWSDIATWRGLAMDNFGDGDTVEGEASDRMAEHRGIVVHIAEGAYEGTIAWERNPASNVSSHFVTSRDGKIAQMVDTDDRSWCQKAGNGSWLSVENEGHTPQELTSQQCELIAQLLARAHQQYGVPLQTASSPTGRGLGYHSMGGTAWGHLDCPGPAIIAQLPGIVARAQRIVDGATGVEGVVMAGFLKVDSTTEVFFTADGTTSQWVQGEPSLTGIKTLANAGVLPPLWNDGAIWVLSADSRGLIPPIVGPVPAGWEDRAAAPAVILTDGQVAILTFQIMAGLVGQITKAVLAALPQIRVGAST